MLLPELGHRACRHAQQIGLSEAEAVGAWRRLNEHGTVAYRLALIESRQLESRKTA